MMTNDGGLVFEYLYRDAGNWKTYGSFRLKADVHSPNCIGACLRDCLESGELFVAEQVSIPSLCEQHWADCGDGPSDLDHAFHEFVGLRQATFRDFDLPELALTTSELLARFEAASFRWDVTLSPNHDL